MTVSDSESLDADYWARQAEAFCEIRDIPTDVTADGDRVILSLDADHHTSTWRTYIHDLDLGGFEVLSTVHDDEIVLGTPDTPLNVDYD